MALPNKLELAQGTIQPLPEGQQRLQYWSWWLLLFIIGWLFVFSIAFPQPLALLGRNWPLFFVGLLGGFLGNATAVGGGIVFIPVMIFVYQVDAVTALKLALATQSFGMSSGALGWLKRGSIPLDTLKLTIPALILGSLISTLLIQPSASLVKGLMGPVSIAIGLITFFKLNHETSRHVIPKRAAMPLFLVTVVGGLVTGWVAIGTGEFVAAFLMLAYGLRAERVIGLGVLLLAVNSIFLALMHQTFLGGLPWDMAVFTVLGAVFGARLGPYLTQWVNQRKLKLGFATIATIDGIIFILNYLWVNHK